MERSTAMTDRFTIIAIVSKKETAHNDTTTHRMLFQSTLEISCAIT